MVVCIQDCWTLHSQMLCTGRRLQALLSLFKDPSILNPLAGTLVSADGEQLCALHSNSKEQLLVVLAEFEGFPTHKLGWYCNVMAEDYFTTITQTES